MADVRKPTRLRGFDYATSGAYFVTICTEGRQPLLGDVRGDLLELSIAGLAVESWWRDIERRFPSVQLGAAIVMPNHVHGVVLLSTNPETERRAGQQGGHIGPPLRAHGRDSVGEARRGLLASAKEATTEEPASLTRVIAWFKTMTTNDYIRGVNELGFPRFDGRLWQRSFHDHVIRNEDDLARIETYILDNPRRWAEDDLNPAR